MFPIIVLGAVGLIKGIGTDLCRISRVERACASEHFLRRVFTREEIDYAGTGKGAAQHLAASFAAKEALAKATGLGIFATGTLDAWVVRTDRGPVIKVSERLRAHLDSMGVREIFVSLTHEGDHALAFVVLEG